ncbi:MAG: DUF2225 domain-containing protein [Lachnospiraceae bacterium]|nr:DUF2225 domain-containing protein [Lachnospiraceae bacterium]
MGLLDGLEGFGLGGLKGMKLYEDPQEEKKEPEPEPEEKKPEEKDFLMDKEYECQVCGKKTKQRIVRTGKAKMKSQDMDLRPVFEELDVIKYDVVVCPFCGYAVLARYYAPMAKPHRQMIREKISANFKQMPTFLPQTISYEDAVTRYKLALLNAVVRQAKNSEKAFICLKSAWLLRGMRYDADIETSEGRARAMQCKKQELEYLINAQEGFLKARSTEPFPIAGMDENTLDYLISALCLETNRNLPDAVKLLGGLLTAKNASKNIKDRAEDMLERIKGQMRDAM